MFTQERPPTPLFPPDVDDEEADELRGTQKMDVVREHEEHLIGLYKKKQFAGDDFSEAIKEIAKRSGFVPSALRLYIAARASDDYEMQKQRAEQLQLLFE